MNNYAIWLFNEDGWINIYHRLPTEEELNEKNPDIYMV